MRTKLPYIENRKSRTYELTLSGSGADGQTLGLPLYEPVAASNSPVAISGDSDVPTQDRFATELAMEYER